MRGILAFIAGFTLIFTILGASASAIGRLFLTHQRALETVSGMLIVLFGAMLVAMAAGVALPHGPAPASGASPSAPRCSAPGPRR